MLILRSVLLTLGALLVAGPAYAAPGFTVILPLGLPQFLHHAPVRGVAWGLVQVGGIGGVALARGPLLESAENEDSATFTTWKIVSSASAAVAAGAWFVSVVDGAQLHAREREAAERLVDTERRVCGSNPVAPCLTAR